MPSTWGATASNGLVTFNALRDAVLNNVLDSKVSYNSIPSGNEAVTKADAESYVWLNNRNTTWNGYASNRCPPKSTFEVLNLCTIVSISGSDILSSTGNSSYPDNTVYVRTANGTTSYTVAGNYQICTRPTIDVPSSEYIYYYAYDNIQYFTVSTISFYPNTVSCSTSNCVSTAYTTKYDAFTCAGCSGGGNNSDIYMESAPTWTIGTRVKDLNGADVPSGYYTYAGKCYRVQPVSVNYYIYKYNPNVPWATYTVQESRITEVINC